MKTIIKLRIYIGIIALMMGCTLTVWGSNEGVADSETKKEINKTFSVNKSDRLQVDNRFGDVTVTHWNKNEVYIRVVVEANARSERRTKELLDYVTVEIDKVGSIVSAKTSMKNFGGNNNNERLRINYYISMPSTFQTDVELKYGNLYLPERTEGKNTLSVKYGNIKAGDFTADLMIQLKYGDLNIKNVKKATLDLAYCGTVRVGDGETLMADTRYSNSTYGYVKKLTLDDKYGNVNMKGMDEGRIQMRYGNLNISKLTSSIIADLGYSNLDVKELSSGFKRFDVEASYGNVTVRIPVNADFNVDARNMKYASYSISGFKANTTKDSSNENHYSEVNNGSKSRIIRFSGNKYSNLNVRAVK